MATRTVFPFSLAFAGLLLFTPLLRGQEPDKAFRQGVEASYKGDFDLAITSFSEAIRLGPKYLPAYNNRGDIYKARGDYDSAIADYDQCIRLDPKYVPAYINRGIAYQAKGDGKRAMADYDEAIRIDPGSHLAYINRGLLDEAGGDNQKAFEDLEKAIHLDPNDALGYNNLAWLLATCPKAAFRDGRKAVEFASKACELTQWKNTAWLDTLAAACAEAGDFEQAVKWETKYLETPNLSKGNAAGASSRLKLYQAHQPYRAEK